MFEFTDIVKLIILNNPEDIRGSKGRAIRHGDFRNHTATAVKAVNEFCGLKTPGYIVTWRDANFSPSFFPMSSIKCVDLYTVKEAKALGIYKEPAKKPDPPPANDKPEVNYPTTVSHHKASARKKRRY